MKRGSKHDRKVAIARQREEDAVQWLLEAVFYACLDWIVDGVEPERDPERIRRIVKPRLASLTESYRAEIARRGLTAADLDARLGWPEGRVDRVLEDPSELTFVEAELLSEALETSTDRMFAPKKGSDP